MITVLINRFSTTKEIIDSAPLQYLLLPSSSFTQLHLVEVTNCLKQTNPNPSFSPLKVPTVVDCIHHMPWRQPDLIPSLKALPASLK